MRAVITILSKGNLGSGPQEMSFDPSYRSFGSALYRECYSYSSDDPCNYTRIALRDRYLGELREQYGLETKPFIWYNDERPIIVEEPRMMQSIPEFFMELIQKAKRDTKHHYILDSTLGAFDCDGFFDISDVETLRQMMFDSIKAVNDADREYNELLKAEKIDELRELGLPIMNEINRYKDEMFRNDPESVINMVKKDGFKLEYLGEEARNNLQVVMEAIKNFPSVIRYAGKSLLDDPDAVIQLVRTTGFTCAVLSDKFRNNRDLLCEALLGYISRGGSLTDSLEYLYAYDDEDYWINYELYSIIKANRQLIEETIDGKVVSTEGEYSNLTEEAVQSLENILREYRKEKISEAIKRNNGVIVTHFGDDLDNKCAIYAIENWLKAEGLIDDKMQITIQRVPAGQVKAGQLNVDTGGHKGSRIEDDGTIVIDGDPSNGIKSACQALSELGIYIPKQIVELADTIPNKVSALDSRSGLALVRYLSGEQAFKLAEEDLLDKSLTDEQLEMFGLTEAHKKQQAVIDNAITKIEQYTVKLPNGERMVLAPEQIIAGSNIAYEMGINYYASVSEHLDENKNVDGVTFAITCRPGMKLPEEVLEFGMELCEQYRIDEKTSGVFVNPNGQMIVAGGFKNPKFKIEGKTIQEMMDEIKDRFSKQPLHDKSEIAEVSCQTTMDEYKMAVSEVKDSVTTHDHKEEKNSQNQSNQNDGYNK